MPIEISLPFLTAAAEQIGAYWPLGFLGIWRWGMFCFRTVLALSYRPMTSPYYATTSVVTPVYNQDAEQLKAALESWATNHPFEIIAVIDTRNPELIAVFEEFATTYPRARCIPTDVPGKRQALKLGIENAKGEIIAVVDCDTLWKPNTLSEGLKPFTDKRIHGVATRQSAYQPRTNAERAQDIFWSQRYDLEMRFLSASGGVVTCASGRTAFYRRSALIPILEGLVTQTFMGVRCTSGDDKYLTSAVQRAGGWIYYQDTSEVYTYAEREIKILLIQRTRWTRNSWKQDITDVFAHGWVWRHKTLVLHQIDRMISPFTLLMSPVFLGWALARGDHLVALFLIAWWLFSRPLKVFPHLRRHPRDVTMIPVFMAMTLANAVIRIYTLFSLNGQKGWGTRWDKDRQLAAPRKSLKLVPYAGMTAVFGGLICLGGVMTGTITTEISVEALQLNPFAKALNPIVDTQPKLEGFRGYEVVVTQTPTPYLQRTPTPPSTMSTMEISSPPKTLSGPTLFPTPKPTDTPAPRE